METTDHRLVEDTEGNLLLLTPIRHLRKKKLDCPTPPPTPSVIESRQSIERPRGPQGSISLIWERKNISTKVVTGTVRQSADPDRRKKKPSPAPSPPATK